MSEYEILSQAGGAVVYKLPNTRYGVVLTDLPGRPGGGVSATPEISTAVADALIADGTLYVHGSEPVIRIPGAPTRYLQTRDHETSFVNRHFFVAVCHGDAPPPKLVASTAMGGERTDAFKEWRQLCAANNLTKLDWYGGGASLGPAFRDAHVPRFRGELSHPIVGPLARGWFVPEAPERPADFSLLKRLFASLPLDAACRATLYTYLLGAFHADSLYVPAPLLCVDSVEQSVGKTETAMAVANILDEDSVGVGLPHGRDTELMTAHFQRHRRIAVIDNVNNVKDWTHPWIACLLSDRSASDRPKYGRVTVDFPGRLVALTFVLGAATLHRDLLSRAWRIELHGPGKPLAHRPVRWAKEYRRELQAQCYWTVAEAPEWNTKSSGTRSSEYEARGAAAYAHLFGIPQGTVQEQLAASLRRVSAYSTSFVRLSKSENVPFPVPEQVIPVQGGPLSPAQLVYVHGATGFARRVVVEGQQAKLEEYTPEVEQI